MNDAIRRGLLNIISCESGAGCCRDAARAVLSLYEKDCGVVDDEVVGGCVACHFERGGVELIHVSEEEFAGFCDRHVDEWEQEE